MKIAITGGSGFIGQQLTQVLIERGYSVMILDRIPSRLEHPNIEYIETDLTPQTLPLSLAQCSTIVHLAGVNILKRWTNATQKEIASSRIDSLNAIIDFLKNHPHSVSTLISASAIGYYGNTYENIVDEYTTLPDVDKNDFLQNVCLAWEKVAYQAVPLGIRVITVRTGIVLAPHGGILSLLMPLFKLFMGGSIGNGQQWVSWISLSDIVQIYREAIENKELKGPINGTSPFPIRNSEFTQALAISVHRRVFVSIPSWLMYIIFGKLSQVMVNSTRVFPKKLTDIGFKFSKPTIHDALGITK